MLNRDEIADMAVRDPREIVGFLARPVEEFLADLDRDDISEPDRAVTTVLFLDIVGSTQKAVDLGDAGWRELLERYHALIR